MQNLRDQLLKTGLVTKAHKQQVEQEQRRARKQLKKGQAEELAQAQQRQAHEARLEGQRAADRQRAAAQRQMLEEREKFLQIQHIIDYWRLPDDRTGSRRWYFVTPNRIVKYIDISEPTALQLSTGALAIVERPDAAESHYVLVERDAAEIVARVDSSYIRFYNADQNSHDV